MVWTWNVRMILTGFMCIIKPQSNGQLYSNTVIGTLVVDGWSVTFGTVRLWPAQALLLEI